MAKQGCQTNGGVQSAQSIGWPLAFEVLKSGRERAGGWLSSSSEFGIMWDSDSGIGVAARAPRCSGSN